MLLAFPALPQASATDLAGSWRASLVVDDAGRELPFGLELALAADGRLTATLVNDPERIEVPDVRLSGPELALALPHYDSAIHAAVVDQDHLTGTWEKTRGKDVRASVPFRAVREARGAPAGQAPGAQASGDAAPIGRWSVRFASDPEAAVAVLERGAAAGALRGTVLTTTGDDRYLAGTFADGTLRLSCFDGAHAFLFEARLVDPDHLAGTFWSGNWYHDDWTAQRDAHAELPDAFGETRWNGALSLADLAFPDLDGELRPLADPAHAGLGYLLVLFGTWCPNCNDEAKLLRELDERYRPRGLTILGLAFELTGEAERDREQVRRFAARYGLAFPLYLAGTADKAAATQAFVGLEQLRAFPTTVFLGADGRVRAVHSGYSGPATGVEHQKLRTRFELLIEELLAAPPASDEPVWQGLLGARWTSGDATYAFRAGADGRREALVLARGPDDAPHESVEPVAFVGESVWIGARAWRFDRQAGVLVDPLRFDGRLWPEGGSSTPCLERLKLESEAALVGALASGQAYVRREALVALAERRAGRADAGLEEALPLLDDPDFGVQRAALWALGRTRELGARAQLLARLDHPNAVLRREAFFACLRLSARDRSILTVLSPRTSSDPDPLTRSALRDLLGEDPGAYSLYDER